MDLFLAVNFEFVLCLFKLQGKIMKKSVVGFVSGEDGDEYLGVEDHEIEA